MFFITQPWLHWVSFKGIKMNNEITSIHFFFLKRFTCKKCGELKVIIFQNKARQHTTIMKNKTQRGPTARQSGALSLRRGGVCCASAVAGSKGDQVFRLSGKTVVAAQQAILSPENINSKCLRNQKCCDILKCVWVCSFNIPPVTSSYLGKGG